MVRRRLLNGIAAGLAGTFVSRNHDIDGYWGLGKLYGMAASGEESSPTVEIDLLGGHGIPDHDSVRRAAARYRERLDEICEGYGAHPVFARAEIALRFDHATDRHQRETARTSGEPYQCLVTLVDESGREASAEVVGWCRRHSSASERRSARADDPEACADPSAAVPGEPLTGPGLYSPDRIRALFDEMASTYGLVNLISSFGFARRWRRQCLSLLTLQEGDVVADLMSGMGELWPSLARRVGSRGRIFGVDLSPAMCAGSEGNRKRADATDVRVHVEDALSSSIESGTVDCVVSTFGLKTFSSAQLARLAAEVKRMLRPGGRLAFLEISVPASRVLRWPYMAYLRQGIPLIGWLCLGNPDNYRHLGAYTAAFGDCSDFVACLRSEGLVVDAKTFFFGCATGLVGLNPDRGAPPN